MEQKITIDEHVTFVADFVRFREVGNALYCSLEGQFLLDGQPFDPILEYNMSDSSVVTRDLTYILKPIYQFLKAEKEL